LICSKCGGEINITDEMLDEAKKSGKPFSVVHDVCPKDVPDRPSRNFRVVISLYERVHTPEVEDDWEDELVAQFGGEYEGPSFEETLPKLQSELNKGWEQVQKMASVIDAQDAVPTPVSTPVDGTDIP
jgi:hypothetical protein